MNHHTARLLVLLLALSFSACGHAASSHHASLHFDGGAISMKNGDVVITSEGHHKARVSGEGKLTIDGSEVTVSPQGKAALAHYNATAVQFTDQAMNLGVDSAGFAMHTVGQVFQGLLDGTVDQAGKEAEQGSKVIEHKAMLLCQRMDDWRLTQDAAAALVPEFRTYAVIRGDDAKDCSIDSKDAPAKPAPTPQPAAQIPS